MACTKHNLLDPFLPQFSPSRNGCGLQMERLPAEIIMKIMFHMDKTTVLNFGSTSKRVRCVWQVNMLAIFKGMKEAQFSLLAHVCKNPSRCSFDQCQSMRLVIASKDMLDLQIISIPEARS